MSGLGYAELAWWLVVAIGAALAGGTGAALLFYRRTGGFPRRQDSAGTGPAAGGALPWAVAKVLVGLVLITVGPAGLLA